MRHRDEIFRKIPGHENYSVSNYGRFKKGRKLINVKYDSQHEYKTVSIDGKRYRAHRIVAMVFCENDDPENKTVVDHINNNKIDNRAENLRWCTVKENTQYAIKDGLRGAGRRGWIVAVELDTMEGRLFKSQKDAGIELGIDPKNVSAVVNGKRKKASGYTFFRLAEINGAIWERDNSGAHGRTKNGSFAHETYNGVTIQLRDERKNFESPAKLREFCRDYLKKYY